MKKINIGLDIGIASVGWAVVNDEEFEIIDAGSRLFKEANNESNGTTAALRRQSRGTRRGYRRNALRREDLKRLFVKQGWLKETDDFHDLSLTNKDVYETRLYGLTNELTINELMMVLFHFMKNRGTFNLKDDLIQQAKEEDTEIDFAEIEKNKLSQPWVCERQLENLKKDGTIHGSNNKFTHEEILREIKAILEKQKSFNLVNQEFIDGYLEIFNRKREFYEGPGEPSPFGWGMDQATFYNNLLGHDSYDRTQKRAPQNGIYANLFNLLNDLNGLSLLGVSDRENDKLTFEEKTKIFDSILNNPNGEIQNLTLRRLAKLLDLKEKNIKGYRIDKKEKAIFTSFKALNEIHKFLSRANLDTSWLNKKNLALLDKLVEICTVYQSYDERQAQINDYLNNHDSLPFPEDKIKAISENIAYCSFSGSHSLSNKTMLKAIPTMWHEPKQGNVVLKEMGLRPEYQFKIEGKNKLIPINQDLINEMYISPVVKRSFIQSLKVLRELQKRYQDYEINNIFIELAREKNDEDQRKFITKQQKLNEIVGQEIDKYCDLSGVKINAHTKKKLRLLIEQNQRCAYCLKPMEWDKVRDFSSFAEIDHIIPESISFSSSLDNLVLVHQQENHEKGQRTPFAYFNQTSQTMPWETYAAEIRNNFYNTFEANPLFSKKYIGRKIANLLDEKDYSLEQNREDFIARNLNDTRYATVAIKDYLSEWKYQTKSETKIKTINGSFTDYIKKTYFNLPPKNRAEYHHHAMDAIAIAYSDKVKNHQITPFEWRDKAPIILDFDYRFSWMRNKNYNRQITNETIYSYQKFNEEWIKIEKINLFTGNPKKLDELFTTKQDSVLMKEADPESFAYLQKIYNEFSGKTYCDEKTKKDKKIVNPFLYYRDVERKPIVKQQSKKHLDKAVPLKTIRYKSNKIGKYLDMSDKYEGISENKKVVLESFKPLRIDIFKNKLTNKYKMLLVNASHVANLSDNDLILKTSEYEKWKAELNINDQYELNMSLYPGDIISLKTQDTKSKAVIIIGGKDKGGQLEYKFIHRDKKDTEPARFYQGISKISNINLINSNILGIKKSEYDVE